MDFLCFSQSQSAAREFSLATDLACSSKKSLKAASKFAFATSRFQCSALPANLEVSGSRHSLFAKTAQSFPSVR